MADTSSSKDIKAKSFGHELRGEVPADHADFYYFDTYAHWQTQYLMLIDKVRTQAYKKAIVSNRALFEGKVVLDVGCGTGILSLFAASAGAKTVYAVEASGILDWATIFFKDNGYGDVIVPCKGTMEEIELPEKVDIIISEWMGYFLLVESMLDTVLYARDKWLKPGGLMFPDRCEMFVCAAGGDTKRLDFWEDVYGFDFTPMRDLCVREAANEVLPTQRVLSKPARILTLDLYTCTRDTLDFESDFKLTMLKSDYCFGICSYFTVTFTKSLFPHQFSTGPNARPTHWRQTQFYFDEPMNLLHFEDVIEGKIVVKKGKNTRDLNVNISLINENLNQSWVCHVLTRRWAM